MQGESKTTRNTVQDTAPKVCEMDGNEHEGETGKTLQGSPVSEDNIKLPAISGCFTDEEVPPLGLEHPPQNPKKMADSDPGGAESGAQPALSTITDPDLLRVVASWSKLPRSVRRGILAMVQAQG